MKQKRKVRKIAKKEIENKREKENLTTLEAVVLSVIEKYAPIKRKDIVQANSMFTDRNVRKSIEHLREKGYPICNVGEGYFMPKSKTDIADCIGYLQRGISGQLKTIDNMTKGLMKFGKKR